MADLKMNLGDAKPTCDICCDDSGIDEGMEWSKLLCGHSFHHLCIHQWFAKHTSCPMCRATIHKCLTCQESFTVNLPDFNKGCTATYAKIYENMKSNNFVANPVRDSNLAAVCVEGCEAPKPFDISTLYDLDKAGSIDCAGTIIHLKPEHKKMLSNIGDSFLNLKAENVDKVVFELVNLVKLVGSDNNAFVSEQSLQALAHYYKDLYTKCMKENVFKLTGNEQSTAMDCVMSELQAESEGIISGELPIFLPPTDLTEEN